jgi:anti-sigma factor RsiW
MACREYEKRLEELEDLLDGRLEAGRRASLEAHLAGCGACREEYEAARAMLPLLRSAIEPAPEASPWFFTRLGARLREARAGRGAVDFWNALEWLSQRVAWTTALVLLVLGSFLAGRHVAAPAEEPRAQIREIFAEPQRPESHDDVLMSLAGNGRGARPAAAPTAVPKNRPNNRPNNREER